MYNNSRFRATSQEYVAYPADDHKIYTEPMIG